MGISWVSHDRLVGDPRDTNGRPMEDPWQTHGGPMSDPWASTFLLFSFFDRQFMFFSCLCSLFLLFILHHRLHSPAQLAKSFYRQRSSGQAAVVTGVFPFPACLHFYRCSVHAVQLCTLVDLSSNFANSRSRPFRPSIFTRGKVSTSTNIHSVILKPKNLILLGVRPTCYSTGDAGALKTHGRDMDNYHEPMRDAKGTSHGRLP